MRCDTLVCKDDTTPLPTRHPLNKFCKQIVILSDGAGLYLQIVLEDDDATMTAIYFPTRERIGSKSSALLTGGWP